jgi:hypothetical protein
MENISHAMHYNVSIFLSPILDIAAHIQLQCISHNVLEFSSSSPLVSHSELWGLFCMANSMDGIFIGGYVTGE